MPADTPPSNRPSPAAAASAGGLPPLPGIDTTEGLRRMANKPALYERVLRDFHRRFCDEAAQIRAALAAGDIASATRRTHSAKGLAGTIGAAELQAAAHDLEAAIKAGSNEQEDRLNRFEAAQKLVIDGIAAGFGLD